MSFNGILQGNNMDLRGFGMAAAPQLVTSGQIYIAKTGANPLPGTLTSPLGTVTIGYSSPNITLDVTGGANPIEKIEVDTFTGPGTNPVLPASGLITVTGGQVAAGTTVNAIRTDSLAANTYTIQIQRSQAVASSTIGDNGIAHFNSSFFTVDANGFVSVAGTGLGQTITGNDGTVLPPTAGNWDIYGNGVSTSGTSTAGNIYTTGSGSTLTINNTEAQFMTNYTSVAIGASPYTALLTDYYISCVSSGGAITIKLPNAPTTNRLFIIKDQSGNASASNISVTTVGGSVTIDGQTTYKIAGNYGAIQLLWNGSSYEVF